MGRGLSKLQMTILYDATFVRKVAGKVSPDWSEALGVRSRGDVIYRRMVELLLGWPTRGFYGRTPSENARLRPHNHPHYEAACASVSRALQRLEVRGLLSLVDKARGRYRLTEEGMRVAREIKRNQVLRRREFVPWPGERDK